MSRIIVPDKRLTTPFTYGQQPLPIDKPVALYIRQSTLMQVQRNRQSFIQQDERVAENLSIMGFGTIIKVDADQGISGQKSEYDRGGMGSMYRMISHEEIGAVAGHDASRFWRDRTHVYDNQFIKLLKKHGVPVILSHRVFWLHVQADEEALRAEFSHSADYLKQIDRMNELRRQSIEAGNFGGHAVPMGFLVAMIEGRKYYVVYEPHAKLIKWLFKRYRQLDGNLARLRHELAHMHFAFPPFEGIAQIPHVGLHFIDDIGYPIQTRGSLVSMLTNVAYIGHYLYDGMLQRDAHEAIVPLGDFMYAYTRLSPTTLTGEVNENKPKVDRTYGIACNALLENILMSGDNKVYAQAYSQSYEARKMTSSWQRTASNQTTDLCVPIQTVDTAFSAALINVLLILEDRYQQGIQDILREQLEALQQEKQEEVISLDTTLANINKEIQGWELDKQSCRAMGNIHGLDEANLQLKRLYADKSEIEEKMKEAETAEEDIRKSMNLTQRVIDDWDGLGFDIQRQYVRLIVKSANLTEASPHFLRLDVILKPPFHTIMTGYIYRNYGVKEAWTDDEIVVIKHLYPSTDRLDILKALPNRSWGSIIRVASINGIARMTEVNTSRIANHLTYADIRVQDMLLEAGMKFMHGDECTDGASIWPTDDRMFHTQMETAILRNKEGSSA